MTWYPRSVPPHPSTTLHIACSHSGGRMGRYRLEAFDAERLVHSAHYDWNVWQGHAAGQLLMPEFVAAAEQRVAARPPIELRIQGLESEAFRIADLSMIDLLMCSGIPDAAVLRAEAGEVELVDENSRPVRTVQEADAGVEDALRWLCARGLAEVRRRPDGTEYAFLQDLPEACRD